MSTVNPALQPDDGKRRSRAGLVKALVVLLVLFAALGGYSYVSFQEFTGRSKFAALYAEGFQLQEQAAREFAGPSGASQPGDHEVAPSTQYVRRILVSRSERAIVVWPQRRMFDDARVAEDAVLRFTLSADGSSWTCRAPGFPPRYLPVRCRG